ncbi:dihydroorotate dehydrogenase (quinone), mitochondrial isoform X1 [Dendrobium catenatum]|uniref:Dihydroorotate dehydrogenase (quinone), mitochondrial n=1 Tax=Dendrobium catenatum TaxID=906689 RepID=A0A2I0WET3_9ASPA|nr:dihydroorotate dehydrogenase (quinone), mitochondrial isoform X1 [Dendrobium catenatum]PKU74173.1 Dihydroorotate dehydrogenase (quinone), mitochondrial [Dendrobium catenatum]
MAVRICRTSLRDAAVKRLGSFMTGGARICTRQLSSGTGEAGTAAPKATLGTAGPTAKAPHPSKKGRLLTGAMIGLAIAGGAYISTADEATFCGWLFSATKLVNPLFALLDAEDAHRLAISAASQNLLPREKRPDPLILSLEVWGRKFRNPIGLAAGFDKNAEAIEGLLGLGFGFVEVGSVTPMPQEGNPKPRIFRLPKEGAILNRCGFNSEGIVVVAKRLGAQHGKRKMEETASNLSSSNDDVKQGGKAGPGILGVNIGKNKTSEDAAADYVQGVHTLSQYADYLVINVSSPNTPGLRRLQGRKQLKDLVKRVQAARDEMQWAEDGPPPLLVKIAPDLSKEDLQDIAAVALNLRLDGLIISNTTISRPDPVNSHPLAKEAGGLSGKPLFDLSTSILREMYILTRGKITLVGCGGISSGEDAYKKVRAGATLVQLYTSFAYGGPALIPQMKAELAECLKRDGFKSIQEAVGADCR